MTGEPRGAEVWPDNRPKAAEHSTASDQDLADDQPNEGKNDAQRGMHGINGHGIGLSKEVGTRVTHTARSLANFDGDFVA
jgi:hypothetical protein